MNVLNGLPKRSQPKAKAALHDIRQAETKADAEKAFDLFIEIYETKYPKATLCLQKDHDERMAFFLISRRCTGRAYAPVTRSKAPSPPSGTEQNYQRAA